MNFRWTYLTALCTTLILTSLSCHLRTNKKNQQTKSYRLYYFGEKPISLDVRNSDFSRNALILNHLVATLVRESASGQMIPFLASEIITNPEKTEWIFRIKKGVTCENGEAISAKSFAQVLLNSLKKYKKDSDLLDFEKLVGAEALADPKTDSIPGISYDGEFLIFRFTSNPEKLLYRIEQPYFGYICEGNYNDAGEWLSENKIISSGTYRVISADGTEVKLAYREDNKLVESVNVKNITAIVTDNLEGIDRKDSIVRVSSNVPEIEGMTFVEGLPTFTTSISLPVHKDGFFSNLSNRKKFLSLVFEEKNKKSPQIKGVKATNTLFIIEKKQRLPDLLKSDLNPKTGGKEQVVTMYLRPSLQGKAFEYVRDLIMRAADKMNLKIVEASDDNAHFKKVKFGVEGNRYDIRVSSVDLGAEPKYALLHMVFCSNLGVSYQSYSNSLCKFIDRGNRQGKGDPLSESEMDDFYRLLAEEYFLVPIFHRSVSYFYSEDFNLKKVANSSINIRFEDLEVNETAN